VQYVPVIVFIILCAVLFGCGVFCVLCLIVVPLPPGTNPFAFKINNNNNNIRLHTASSIAYCFSIGCKRSRKMLWQQ
jgi:hypothetical protein